MNKTDQTTLQRMGEALLRLMRHKPLEKITADELAAEANVGRVTYFRNYSSKDDLLSSYLLQSYKQYCTEHLASGDIHEKSAESLLCLFSFCYGLQDTHRQIVAAGHEAAIYEAYRLSFLEDTLPAQKDTSPAQGGTSSAQKDTSPAQIDTPLTQGDTPPAPEAGDYLNALVDYGLFGVIHHWIMNGCRQSPQEMTDWFAATVRLEDRTA